MRINNAIKNKPFDAPFFKSIMVVPVVGQVIQIWKRYNLCRELKSIGLNDVDIKSPEGKTRYNQAVTKVVEIFNFGLQSCRYGRVADLACIIVGVAIGIFVPPLSLMGGGFIVFGIASLMFRKFSTIFFDQSIQDEIRKKRPNTGTYFDGYAFIM